MPLAVVSILTLLHAAGSVAAVSVHADVLAPFQTVSKQQWSHVQSGSGGGGGVTVVHKWKWGGGRLR